MLAVVHGDVGVLDQLLRTQAVGRCAGNADAGGDRELVGGEPEGLGECGQQGIGQALGTAGVIGGVADHQELVAAETGHAAFIGDRAPDPFGRLQQQFVTCTMAQHVVDGLEPVQVDVQQPHLGQVRIGQALAELVEYGIAVHQPGQRVRACLHPQGFLGALAWRDVLQGAGDL